MNERHAPTAWVSPEDQHHRMTLEALADVDAGRVIDHNVIVDWVNRVTAVQDGDV